MLPHVFHYTWFTIQHVRRAQVLAEELSRRLGRERCWRVRWPGVAPKPGADGEPLSAAGDGGVPFRKDANHVLMEDGPERLGACLDAAEPYPIRGLFRCVLCGAWRTEAHIEAQALCQSAARSDRAVDCRTIASVSERVLAVC